jgi:ribosomal protein S18 acetylase RimI-like enzyme
VGDGVSVRRLSDADAPALWALRLEALEREPGAYGSSPEEHQRTTPEQLAATLRAIAPDSFVVGAFVDGELRGMAGFSRDARLKTRHRGVVWGVYVAADVRGRALGRRMLEHLLAEVRATPGIEWVKLCVAVEQTVARRLYASVGFTPIGIERSAIKIGGHDIDEEHMEMRVTSD